MIILHSKKQTGESNMHILNLLCAGQTYKQIAKTLYISKSRLIWRISEMRFKNDCINTVALCVKYTLASHENSEVEFYI